METTHNDRMKAFSRIPMYTGLSVFVLAVVLSAVKVSENRSVTNLTSRASATQAVLTLNYTKPNIVSVLLTSNRDVAGLDVGLTFDPTRMTILPTTLTGGPGVVTTGGLLNEKEGTFAFSALPQGSSFTAGIVATFTISAKSDLKEKTTLSFDTNNSRTVVLERGTSTNVLSRAEAVNVEF
jgi:hypothetical protein